MNRKISLKISYPQEKYPKYDSLIRKVLGIESSASGMGFGSRDLVYQIGYTDAGVLVRKLTTELDDISIEID